jgi:hypothetical protein
VSIDELNKFTQAIGDDDDEVRFDVAYDEAADGGDASRMGKDRDLLLDLFRASQSFSQVE